MSQVFIGLEFFVLFLLLVFCVVFFPLKCISQVCCGYDRCRFEHAYNCSSCYVKPSFIKTALLWRAGSQPYTDSWSQSGSIHWYPSSVNRSREVSEVLHRCTNLSVCIRLQDQGLNHHKGTAVLLPSQARPVRDDLQAAKQQQGGIFSAPLLFFIPFQCEC